MKRYIFLSVQQLRHIAILKHKLRSETGTGLLSTSLEVVFLALLVRRRLQHDRRALHLGVPRPVHDVPHLALFAHDSPGDLLGRPAKVGEGLELDAALVLGAVVGHGHLALGVDSIVGSPSGGDLATRW